MKNQLVHIPKLHNNNYGFFDVLAGLCKLSINAEFTFTDISSAWNKTKKTDITAIDLFAVAVEFQKVLNWR